MILSKKRFNSFRSLLGPLFLAALLFCSVVTPAGAVINASVAPGGTVDIVIDPFRPNHTTGWGQFTYLGLAGPFANGTTSKVSMSGIVVDEWGTGNFNGTSPNNRIYYGSDTLRYTNNGTGLNTTVSINATWGNGMDTQADTINILITNSGASVVSINMMDPNPTVASSVRWQVQFDQAVTGVNTGNFQLTGGVTGAAVTGVSGSGSSWTVTAGTGTGTGLLGLNMVNSTGTNPQVLGLTFTGQPYSFDQAPTIVTYPANITILANQTATLTATVGSRSASGSDPIRYQWYNAAVGTMSNPVCAQGAVTTSPAVISCTVGPLSATPANGYWVDVWNNYNAGSLHTVSTDGRVTVNHAPTMATNLGLLASKNSALTLTAPRLQATDPEQDSSSLTYTVTAGPGHGTLNSSTFTQWDIDNGVVIYTPTSGYVGSDSFSFSLSDGQPAPGEGKLNSSAAISVNDVPSFVGSTTTLTVNRNSGATDIKGLLHVSDTDSSQTETWTQSAAPDHGGTLAFSSATATSGTTNITPGGTITYTPANGYSGTETFTVQVSDGTATATRTITVTVNAPPTVTDAKISISGASGTGGAYKIGDTVTATWNNTAAGDNNTDVTNVTVDFSAFGGGAAVVAANSSGTWTATYIIVAGAIDGINKNVSVTATNSAGSITTADTTNATVDNIAPTVTDANISISGATGTGGAFRYTDTVTVTWNNTAAGDNNADTISGVTVDFSQFGGGSAVAATNSGGIWTATYFNISRTVDGINKNVSVTATDNAGNATTTADTANATVDNIYATVTSGAIGISGATGTGGTFRIGDTVIATWNNTAGGDNNPDIVGATVNFNAFGGGSAVAASNSGDIWTATYTIVPGPIDTINRNVSVTAIDNAGNTTTTAGSSNATVDNWAPNVTNTRITLSGATGSGGAFRIGDTVTASWNNTAGGDSNFDISGVTVDFSAFGGGAAVVASQAGHPDTWTATYIVVAGSIDAINRNVSVTATDNAGNSTTTAGSSNATVDNIAPTVTDATISISGASGSSGAYKIGDTVTATWNNTAAGDNNADTISGVTVDFSQFGGGVAVVAGNGGGSWTATYTIVAGSIDATNRNVTVTASDNAGNTTAKAGTTNATVDNRAPTVTTVAVPSNATYSTAQAMDFTINWSENVSVTGTDSTLGLTIGSSSKTAAYQSKTTSSITYRYTVQNGDVDNDSITVGILTLNSSTIQDAAGNNAVLTLNAVASTASVLVDGLVPTATAANSITATGFTANWNSATGATGYYLDVSTSNTFASFVGTYNNLDVGSATSQTVTGLSASSTYYYRVRAYNGGGTSGNSGIITVLTVPAAPTATAASAVNLSGFTANWGSATGASGYYLDVAEDSGFASIVASYNSKDVGNVTTATVTGLSANTPYWYRVRAYNTSGASDNSSAINPTTATTRTVTSNADSGSGSLRATIAAANPGDQITFDAGLNGQTITLSSVLTIDKDLTISGPGAANLTISGDNTVQIFNQSGASFTLQGLTLASGYASLGGALYIDNNSTTIVRNCVFSSNSAGIGGAITVSNATGSNVLTVESCTFTNNSADTYGGAIGDWGTLTITGSTFSGNTAIYGGGIFGSSGLSISNCTFSNNSATSQGGGIYSDGTTVSNCTFSGNSATSNGGGIYSNMGLLTIRNTVLWGNTAPSGPQISGPANVSYSIVQGGYAGAGNLNTDPLLGALGANGGPTQTMALRAGSPAINAGNNATCTATDQRGMTRPQDATCDMGAYERGVPAAVTATAGTPQSTAINSAFGTGLSAKVTDSLGGVLDGISVDFAGPGSGAGMAAGGSVNTDTSGIASFSATANATAGGPYSVSATSGALAASFSLTNNKATPIIAWPTATAITYGQTLASSTLSGGASTPAGTFTFTSPATAPGAGSATQGVTFTPADAANYNTITGTATVTVNKSNSSVTNWPAATAITYGQTLASSTLSGGISTPAGTFVFTAPATVPNAGTASQGVTFTPADTTNYNSATGTAAVTVNTRTLTVNGITAASKTYDGSTTATLNTGSATLAGNLDGGNVVLNTGSASGEFITAVAGSAKTVTIRGLSLSGSAISNYTLVQPAATADINKANSSVIAWPATTAITYGQSLASSTLSGGVATLAGTFAFTAPATVPLAGTASQEITFTPADTANYNSATGSASVTVNPASAVKTIPAIIWGTPAAIAAGTPLSATQLNATANVSGTFSYTPAAGAVLDAGTQTLSVSFTPDDTANYDSASASVTVTVMDLAPPTLTGFTIQVLSDSLTVPVISLAANDNVGVSGYLLSESSSQPQVSDAAWTATIPASYPFVSQGVKTLYAFAKDAAGNVSVPAQATVAIAMPDTTFPVVDAFSIPGSSTSLTVPITTLIASDNAGVTSWLLSESATQPAADDTAWSATKPAGYTFATQGAKILHAFARDAAGNISAPLSAGVIITLADRVAPAVDSFIVPASLATLTCPVTTLSASDNIGVTGYYISESASQPQANDAAWSATVPASYIFISQGTKTLYVFVKDAAGNISAPATASVTITMADITAPAVTSFAIPATSASLTVVVSTFTATDNTGVTGYLISEAPTASVADSRWTTTRTNSYTFDAAGTKTLYAFARDAAGNVSVPATASVTITLADSIAPTVNVFTAPATLTTLTCPVTTLTATDNVAVTGFYLSENATVPDVAAAGWTSTPPAAFTFGTEGSKALYAFAKDGAGNISAPAAAHVTITLPIIIPVVNGVCGSANNSSFTTAPTTNLCSSGSASSVTGSGPWNWSCNGLEGGSSATCQAGVTTSPVTTFSVTPSAGAGSSISPSGVQSINQGATASFTVTATPGFGILSVTGCGGALNGTTYTTAAISGNCSVSVTAIERTGTTGGGSSPPTIADALRAFNAFAGGVQLTPEELIRYDVAPLSAGGIPQGNGVVDFGDIILILRRSIGIGNW